MQQQPDQKTTHVCITGYLTRLDPLPLKHQIFIHKTLQKKNTWENISSLITLPVSGKLLTDESPRYLCDDVTPEEWAVYHPYSLGVPCELSSLGGKRESNSLHLTCIRKLSVQNLRILQSVQVSINKKWLRTILQSIK